MRRSKVGNQRFLSQLFLCPNLARRMVSSNLKFTQKAVQISLRAEMLAAASLSSLVEPRLKKKKEMKHTREHTRSMSFSLNFVFGLQIRNVVLLSCLGGRIGRYQILP